MRLNLAQGSILNKGGNWPICETQSMRCHDIGGVRERNAIVYMSCQRPISISYVKPNWSSARPHMRLIEWVKTITEDKIKQTKHKSKTKRTKLMAGLVDLTPPYWMIVQLKPISPTLTSACNGLFLICNLERSCPIYFIFCTYAQSGSIDSLLHCRW